MAAGFRARWQPGATGPQPYEAEQQQQPKLSGQQQQQQQQPVGSLTVSDDGAGGGRHLELQGQARRGIRQASGTTAAPAALLAPWTSAKQASFHGSHLSRTSSAANLSTAVNGASSGTLNTRNGSLGSLVSTTLKDTLLVVAMAGCCREGSGRLKRGRQRRRRRGRSGSTASSPAIHGCAVAPEISLQPETEAAPRGALRGGCSQWLHAPAVPDSAINASSRRTIDGHGWEQVWHV